MPTTYLYDSSLPGLLSTLYECLALNFTPAKIMTDNKFQEDLFTKTQYIETSQVKASKLINKLRTVSYRLSGTALYAYTAEKENYETALLEYIKLGLRYGEKVETFLTNPHVEQIMKLVNSVRLETHRLKGFVRFRELVNGLYYAPLEPDGNIVPLLGRHFQTRMADQEWLIHDVKRNIAIFYNKQHTQNINLNLTTDFNKLLSGREKKYQILWQEFHRSISIGERQNSKLQKQWMPARYWKYLVEIPRSTMVK